MYTVNLSSDFTAWFDALEDVTAKRRINARILRLALGHEGDAKPVGEGVRELRVHVGPGYRVYYVRRDGQVFLLLCGGDKSTQRKDIARAIALAKTEG